MHTVNMLGYFLLYHSGRLEIFMYKIDFRINGKQAEPYTTRIKKYALHKLDALMRNKQTTSIILTSQEDRTALTCISYD